MIPYGLRKIWGHSANSDPGGGSAVARCLFRSGTWGSYQLKKRLKLFLPQGSVIPWDDGLQVRLLGSSQHCQACFYYGLSDWPPMQFLRRFARHGDLCADIGANVGTYSLLLARHAGASQVHCFEVPARKYPQAARNLRLNGFDGPEGVVEHDVALADCDGLVLLNVSDGDSTASISSP